MSEIRIGVQTYSWQMSYATYRGQIEHIAGIGEKAGFRGMEAEACMLDNLFPNVEAVREIMNRHGMTFAALALPLNWLNPTETEEERELADKAIKFVKEMGEGCKLALCHLPQKDRSELEARQRNQIMCITEIARRASDQGVTTGFHPNSSFGSAFRTREDYDLLLNGIMNTPLGFVPDAGHIAHGNIDPLELIRTYRDKVIHVHFKDMSKDGIWRSMGKGDIDFPGIVNFLRNTDYAGWIMVEEESVFAETDPDAVTIENGKYMAEL